MIVCVTPNPALDHTLLVPGFSTDGVFRPQQVIADAGGKGINVARAIQVLGSEARCSGFLGGHTGQQNRRTGAGRWDQRPVDLHHRR